MLHLYYHKGGNIMNVTHGRGYVYAIQYHIAWCVKYRRKILTEEVESKLINILNKIADDNQRIKYRFRSYSYVNFMQTTTLYFKFYESL